MEIYTFTLKTLSAFGTPFVGDSLFGQLCWAMVHRFGEEKLKTCLKGYDQQDPFLVVSDAFQQGYLPMPTLPSVFWQQGEETDRKVLKKKQWIQVNNAQTHPVSQWQILAVSEWQILAEKGMSKTVRNQTHNTLNRQTQTTGTGIFAPYSMSQIWYAKNTLLDVYVVFDKNRISLDEIKQVFTDIGQMGFGRDASIGLGKFELLNDVTPFSFTSTNPNAYLSLANCSPQKNELNKDRSFYQITTRFGRHGDMQALGLNPFKKPIILTKAGAVFTPNTYQERLFIGNGLTGVSYAQSEAVHQGYAPVMPIYIDFEQQGKNDE